MVRLACLLSALALCSIPAQAMPLGVPQAPATVTPVHGCHGDYSHDMKGWHRHGKRCETQRGLARAKREKKRAI